MGKYTIIISGEGPHHNPQVEGEFSKDSNIAAMSLVDHLKRNGHQITSAVFNTETTTDDLDALTRPGNETLLYGGVAGGGMTEAMSGAQNENPGSGGPGHDPSIPYAVPPYNTPVMKIFEFEAKDGDNVLDTLYVQGETEEAARQTFKDRGFDDMPDDMLTVTEVTELPEGEELLNPA